ncbi:MAG TPA: lysylphosphatidylglycerol synthase domain-containing protein [Gemmatimonadales bacterium]|nr:lysylphosphatidylglycerol synthase domain-containing protein [Gemmatimonadales bacterium]
MTALLRSRATWWWIAQAVVLAVVVVLVGRALARNWDAFRNAQFSFSLVPGWLAISLGLVGLTYLVLIDSWRRILLGWNQPLGFRAATRIWFLANLGRYVPGKVWSVAGMVVLAQREGVQPWAATASAVAVQAIGIGTAVAVVAAAAPGAESPLRLAIAAGLAIGTMGLLAWEFATRQIRRLVPRFDELRPIPVSVLLVSTGLTLIGWLLYGVSFWALGRGLGLPPLGLPMAAAVFALGYILGLLALFAPGGAGVREVTFVALLTPALGAGPAIGLSLASRLVLTLTEAAGGIAALVWTRSSQGVSR